MGKSHQLEYRDTTLVEIEFGDNEDMNKWRLALIARYLNLVRLLLVIEHYDARDVPAYRRGEADVWLARHFAEEYPNFPPPEIIEITRERQEENEQ